jgi:hypothetical protein
MMKLQRRLTGLLVNPKAEWAAIAAEPADIASLYLTVILILAAVGPLALLLRITISGAPIVGFGIAVGTYLVSIANPIVSAVVVEKLAPKFGSHGTTVDALKLVAYSSTPAWVAGALYLIPGLGAIATLVGVLYGIYLFALGLPRLLHTPREQIVPFMVVCALVILVINTLLSALFSRSMGRF